jgi:hypothetical protein
MKIVYIIVIGLLSFNIPIAQTLKIQCTEKEKKNDDGKDPILIKTCLYKNFKFIITSYPDYAGRYVYSEHQIFVRSQSGYSKTTNDQFFNKAQAELVVLINERIQHDFNRFASDSNTRDCLTEIDSLPVYNMNDFEISFYADEIWFEVHWGLISACRAVDGTIITFKFNELKKYLK